MLHCHEASSCPWLVRLIEGDGVPVQRPAPRSRESIDGTTIGFMDWPPFRPDTWA